jgi:hypothetical protein
MFTQHSTARIEPLEARQLLSVTLPDHAVRIAYLIPSNRTAQTDAVATLRTAIKWYQDYFADQMERNGFGRKTFAIETLADGTTPDVHVLSLPQTDSYYRADSWGRVQADASAAGLNVGGAGASWLLFFEGHVESADGHIDGGSAGGTGPGTGDAGGVAVLGSDMIPLMNSSLPTDSRAYAGLTIPALGPYPLASDAFISSEGSTLSSVASSRIGAVLHEMTHTFGVAHGYRNDENFHGNLMGNGLRGFRGNLLPDQFPDDWTRLEYADALALSHNRFFNAGQNFSDNILPIVSTPSGTIVDGSLQIDFSATDAGGLSAALLGDDSGIIDQKVLSGTGTTTSFSIPDYAPGQTNQYHLFVYDAQGNRTDTDFAIGVPTVTNRAPKPFMKIQPANETVKVGQTVTLDASASTDPEMQALTYEWDWNGNGVFDTGALTSPTYSLSFASAGTRLLQLKVTDASGASSVSAPIGIRIVAQTPPPAGSGSITGVVADDADGDGSFDVGEKGLSGAKVYLDANKNRILDAGERSTLSDASGNFTIDSLDAGTYRIAVVPPSGGWRQTTSMYLDRTVKANQATPFAVVGLTQSVAITGQCFSDADNDGVKDPAEAVATNWFVYIDSNNDGVWNHATGQSGGKTEPSAVTDSSGFYRFSGLPAGTYRVRLSLDKTWRAVRPSVLYRDLTVSAGGNAIGQDFAVTHNPLITGQCFNDQNGNGKLDKGEGGLKGWTVFADTNKNGKLDVGEHSTKTDAVGKYSIGDLPAGSYRIRCYNEAGWRLVAPAWAYYDLNPGIGATLAGKDFACTQKVLVSGSVFNDVNGDAMRQSSEVGLSGWRVYLDANNDGKWQSSERSILTDATGKWSWSDLTAGVTYRLRVVGQSGWKGTAPKSVVQVLTPVAGAILRGTDFGQRKIT